MSQEDVNEQIERAEIHNPGGGGVDVEFIDGLPTATHFRAGDRLIVSSGVEPATLTGTCSGVSSDPNITTINGESVSVDAGLNAVDFAAAIVAAFTPTQKTHAGIDDMTDNGDGTFDVDFVPGVAPNTYEATGTDGNPSFELTYPGSSEIEQVDASVIQTLIDDTRPYQVVTGIIKQTGTNVPFVDKTHENTLSDLTLQFSRSGVGQYSLTFAEGGQAFLDKRVWFTIKQVFDFNAAGGAFVGFSMTSAAIAITTGTLDLSGTPIITMQDGVLGVNKIPFELRVYPE